MPGPFNTGRDVSIDVAGPNGIISLSLIVDFTSRQMVSKLKSSGLDGVTRFYNVPDGWGGGISIDRADRNLDDLIAAYENSYYNGSVFVFGTITQTIQEVNGTISQWRYQNAVFSCSDAGNWRKDSNVTPKLDWEASRRISIA